MRGVARIEKEIQRLREELDRLISQEEDCDKVRLLEVSQKLDVFIYEYIKSQYAKN